MFAKILILAVAAWLLSSSCTRAEADTGAPTPDGGFSIGRSAGTWIHGRPGLRPSRVRSSGAAAPAYTIVDIGAPTFDSYPAGFNSTGQIFGRGGTDCYVWTGSSFERLPIPSAGKQFSYCLPASMNDAKPDGTYEIVGSTAYPTSYSTTYAFDVTGGAPTVYYGYENSTLLGVNDNGISVADALFEPANYNLYAGHQVFTAAGGADYLTPLQAPVYGPGPIHYLIPYNYDTGYPTPPCPFGGCVINDRNVILGFDAFGVSTNAVNVAAYTLGEPSSLIDLPIKQPTSSTPIAFNDRDEVLYNTSSAPYNAPAIYNIATGKTTLIPLVTPSCTTPLNGNGLSMNNKGEVLGYRGCEQGNVYCGCYFTWDAVSGTQDLNTQIPDTNLTLYPVGINDAGQILIGLLNGSLLTWGTLDPVAPSPSHKLR